MPPTMPSSFCASLNRSSGSYDSRSKNRFTLSCEMPMTCDSRVQVVDLGSLIKNPMYIGKVHRAVGGRVGFLINQEFDHQSILLPTEFAMRINA